MKKLIATMVLAGSSLFAGPRIAIRVGIGVPVAPARVVVAPAYVPPCPGPGYNWVAGYWVGPMWHAGYWARPVAPLVVAPRYYGQRYDGPHYYHRDRR